MEPSASARHPGTTPADVLQLREEALRAMVDHCRREAPREACGIVAGVRYEPASGAPAGAEGAGRRVVALGQRAIPMRNVAEDPVRRYLMEPEEQFRVMRELRQTGEELVVIYHSHPVTAPIPSATDIQLAYTKDAVYLIISLAEERPLWRAWWLDCDTRRVEEVAVEVVP